MSSEERDFDSEDERIENLPVLGNDDDEVKPSNECYRCLLEQCDKNEVAALLWIYEHRFGPGCKYYGYCPDDPCIACTVELVEHRMVHGPFHAEDCEYGKHCTESEVYADDED